MLESDTIAAIATAPGRSGIGIVRVSGPGVRHIISQIVSRPVTPRRAVFAEFVDAAGATMDSGIALFFPTPGSYTGEDVLELQGHGGPVVLGMLLERCVSLGARVAEPGEFTRRAFLNGRMDLAQAEAVIDLIDAATSTAARSAIRSVSGQFSQLIQSLVSELRDTRVLVEATLDFPEEDVEDVHRDDLCKRLDALGGKLDNLLQAAQQGSLLRDGVHIVLAGPPNAGKSSLLNQLAGQELAIVTEIPGTTRDTIREVIDLSGVPAYIIDTAGLRAPRDPVEAIGVRRTRAAVEKADLVLWVVDAAAPAAGGPAEPDEPLPEGVPQMRVMNKIDLIDRTAGVERHGAETVVWLSAKTGAGIEVLRESLLHQLGWRGTGEGVVLARARHLESLRTARERVARASRQLGQVELLAEELRLADDALGAIVGRTTPDELLGEIFARFCLGK
ncbi:MAG: tRNA uridine-5-carboxymethylaminomethyl(34) synthesis GTPase MnmE [Betaproteobacteria bacterium]